jgi:mono/diheme cytochrome c family protein
MISARMTRAAKVFLALSTAVAVTGLTSACGTQRISVPKSSGALYQGAVLFNQRCSGCHTLSYAATHGSAANVRTAQFNNGPNFDTRCERTANGAGVERVLYAITNGGFSGGIMPQNVVVGQQAVDVAEFVATYAGRQAPSIPGVTPCDQLPVGSPPPPPTTSTSTTPTTATTTTTATTPASPTARARSKAKAKAAAKSKHKS